MKTLIENSIKINGIGYYAKTIFQLNIIPPLDENATEEQKRDVMEKQFQNQRILDDLNYKSLTKISGRKLTINFSYSEEDNKIEDKLQMTIVKSEDENVIKNFIVSQINDYLK